MKRWEKILFVFFIGFILLAFLWAVRLVDRTRRYGLEELRDKRVTESISIPRVSKED